MSALLVLIAQGLHLVLMLALAPVLAGCVARMAARMAGRAGAPVMQPWRDMARALRRLPVVPEGAGPMLRAAPALRLGVLVVAAAMVPGFTRHMALPGDLLVIAGLLALARAVAALGALDEGSAAAGQVAGAAMTRAALAEPVLLLVAFVLALAAGGTGLEQILGLSGADLPGLVPALLALGLAVAIVALADLAWEGPTPELSGRHEALAAAGDALRLMVWLSLLAALFLPPFLPPWREDPALMLGDWLMFLPVWLGKLALLGAAVAAVRVLGGWARGAGSLGLAGLLVLLAVAMLFVGAR